MAFETKKSLLSDSSILRCLKEGTVVIQPYNQGNLNTSSYDVTLGRNFYRETIPEPGQGIYNPFSKDHVKKVWGSPQTAIKVRDWSGNNNTKLENINDNDEIIWLSPGETILAHTNEFIGGRHNVTTMMKARSSLGRNFIEVCKCAGWGDVGYVNRWTMEITNNSKNYSIPLVVGRRVAQIVFFGTDHVCGIKYDQDPNSKYQKSTDLEELEKNWRPEDMLPKMYLDREITEQMSF